MLTKFDRPADQVDSELDYTIGGGLTPQGPGSILSFYEMTIDYFWVLVLIKCI